MIVVSVMIVVFVVLVVVLAIVHYHGNRGCRDDRGRLGDRGLSW